MVPYSKKIHLGKSNIHGTGIIAKRDIQKGEIVFVIKGEIKDWEVRNEEEALYGEDWIGIGRNVWIDPMGFGKFINHSSTPNAGIVGRVVVKAMRKIKKGEEVTMDYSTTEEQLMWYLHDAESGEKVKSIQFIPKEKFKKYLPFIPKYFQKVYHRHHKSSSHG